MLPIDRQTMQTLNADAPEWVADGRRRGFDYFEKLGMPSSSEEAWRYVDLDFELRDLGLPTAAGTALADDEVLRALGDAAGRATWIDGETVDVTSAAGDGIIFTSLRRAFTEHEAELRSAFGSGIAPDLDAFSAAHHAFMRDGVFLYVPHAAAAEAPFVVDVQATGEGLLYLPHLTIVAEDNSEASVIVTLRSREGASLVVVPQTEVSVRDGARLRLTRVQNLSYAATAVQQARLVLGRDASAVLGEAGLGAKLGRLDLTVDLMGRGGNAEVVGLYFGEHDQVLDYRLVINHHGRNTNSNVFLKGAVEDEAESVFTGLLKIWRDAAKVSAFETNRNLVLSEGAKAHSVPNLEILCDDVICGHGSTVGPLDDELLYYLMSRGLPRDRAARMLVRGFFEEVIRKVPHPVLAAPLREEVNAKFVAAQQEGRV